MSGCWVGIQDTLDDLQRRVDSARTSGTEARKRADAAHLSMARMEDMLDDIPGFERNCCANVEEKVALAVTFVKDRLANDLGDRNILMLTRENDDLRAENEGLRVLLERFQVLCKSTELDLKVKKRMRPFGEEDDAVVKIQEAVGEMLPDDDDESSSASDDDSDGCHGLLQRLALDRLRSMSKRRRI